MAWSKDSIDAINGTGMTFSRRHEFNSYQDYIVVNHGSHSPIAFGPKVKKAIVLNAPDNVKWSINKNMMYQKAIEAGIKNIPKTFSMPGGKGFIEAIDAIGLPLILKPNVGHGGEGCMVIDKPSQLIGKIFESQKDYIAQQYIPKTSEYRFNFLAGQLVNVSRKLLPAEASKHPGVFDGWLSLGQATSLHKRAHKMAVGLAAAFPLPSLAVDLLRVDNKDEDKVQYFFCEVNSAYGLGPMTAQRMFETITQLNKEGKLDTFRVV